MPTTRSSDPFDDIYLEHFIAVVLEAPSADASYRMALKAMGTETTDDLLYLSKVDLSDFIWTKADGSDGSLTPAEVNKILALQEWFQAQEEHTEEVWLTLTSQDFKEYRLNARIPTTTTMTTPATTSSATMNAAEEFTKGIKKSISDYTSFKDKKNWNSWQCSLIATGYNHGISNVFDPNYTPTDEASKALFAEQQRFAFSIFTKHLHEPEATGILRNYSDETQPNYGDAQALYKDLVATFSGGIAASLSATELETEINNFKLTDNWNKPITTWFSALKHKFQDLDLVSPEAKSDQWKNDEIDSLVLEHKTINAQVNSLCNQVNIAALQSGGSPIK